MSATRLAIIIPAYQAADFLSEAIRTALLAPGAREILVVDDASTDATAEIARSFAPRVRLLCRPHAGVSAARNAGLAATSGGRLLFLDADDLLVGERVANLLAASISSGAEAVYGDFQSCWKRPDGTWEAWPVRPAGALEDPLGAILGGWFVPPGGIIFERAALERSGGFNESFPTMNDKELLARLAARSVRFRYVPGLVLYHRDHGNARLSRQTMIRCRMGEAILDRHVGELEATGGWTGFRRRQVAAEYFRLALAFEGHGDSASSAACLGKALQADFEFSPPGLSGLLFRLARRRSVALENRLAGAWHAIAPSRPMELARTLLIRSGLRKPPARPAAELDVEGLWPFSRGGISGRRR
jgi:glycosyltransferase involved in cell wall biosynthesis